MAHTKQQERDTITNQIENWLAGGNKIKQINQGETGIKDVVQQQREYNARDLSGNKFGNLTILHRSKNPMMRNHWMCECQCGNLQLIETQMILSGKTVSCSKCKKSAKLQKQDKKQTAVNLKRLRKRGIDIAGKRFGCLVAVEIAQSSDGIRRWRCKCDCGAEKTIVTAKLRNGSVQSCGACDENKK